MPISSSPPSAADPDPLHLPRSVRRLHVKLAAAACLGLALIAGALSLATPAGARLGYKLTLTATPASGVTGTPLTITAVANKKLPARSFINIWQAGDRRVLRTCRTDRCKVTVTPPGGGPSRVPFTTYTTYRAQISRAASRHVPAADAFATVEVKVGRTSQISTCPPTCPTM
jgi:hypothetical protein